MRRFFFSLLGYFLTPPGLVVMGILDASMVFFLPLGIDFVVIIMTARQPALFWAYALLATVGSVVGAGLTYWIGRKIGEVGLKRFINPKRLRHIKARVNRGVALVAALAVVPPPFPFTPFVLTAGALGMNPWAFLSLLGGFRALRFGVEASLASRYGSRIVRWMKTPTFEAVVIFFIGIAVIGTAISLVALVRGSRGRRRKALA